MVRIFKLSWLIMAVAISLICFSCGNGSNADNGDNNTINDIEEESIKHDFVDLGLPSGTLWATCNIGADTPEGYGDYFAWGETKPKEVYDENTYKYCKDGDIYNKLTKYCNEPGDGYNGYTDNLNVLDKKDDAAAVNWGDEWRMPTKEQWDELKYNCSWTWTSEGYKVVGPNGNSIFLPAAGRHFDNKFDNQSCYWTSSLNTTGMPFQAWYFELNANSYGKYDWLRNCGYPIRPVVYGTENTKTKKYDDITEDLKDMLQEWLDKDVNIIHYHAPELVKLENKLDDMARARGDMVGYFDEDTWFLLQEEFLGRQVVDNVSMLSTTTAEANITIYYGNNKDNRRVSLEKVSGTWEIVDFWYSNDGKSFKEKCEDGIKEMEGKGYSSNQQFEGDGPDWLQGTWFAYMYDDYGNYIGNMTYVLNKGTMTTYINNEYVQTMPYLYSSDNGSILLFDKKGNAAGLMYTKNKRLIGNDGTIFSKK